MHTNNQIRRCFSDILKGLSYLWLIWTPFLISLDVFATDQTFTQTDWSDFYAGTNNQTQVWPDGRVLLQGSSSVVLATSTSNWGMYVAPPLSNIDYVWVEAEDVMTGTGGFTRASTAGGWNNYGPHRWSNDYSMIFSSSPPISGSATSNSFSVNLPRTDVPYRVLVRTDQQSWNNIASAIELYVDGSLAATGSTGSPNALRWNALSGTISGGNHQVYIKIITPSQQTHLEQVEVDSFLFTTDSAYTPPNPVDTNGKLVGWSVSGSGCFISAVIDTGTATAAWRDIAWEADVPTGTALTLQTRTGPTATPDGSWSEWSDYYSSFQTGEAILSPTARYIQYCANLASDSKQSLTPSLRSVDVMASNVALPSVRHYGIYSIPVNDSGSIPGYNYTVQANDFAYYDLSVLQGNSKYGASGTGTLVPDVKALNSNHKFYIRLAGFGNGQNKTKGGYGTGLSVLDYYYDTQGARTTVRNMWAAQIAAAGGAANIAAVSISEEEPNNAWIGFITSGSATCWAQEYAAQYTADTGAAFNWSDRYSTSPTGYLTWLQSRTQFVFNDAYDWLKATYPSLKVYQFMYTPSSTQSYGMRNLPASQYSADGWIVQYWTVLPYAAMNNWIQEIRDSGIPNSEIQMQVWGGPISSTWWADPVWQTLQAKSLGIENIWCFYTRAWIPPSYPVPCDYFGLDNDGTRDGIIQGTDWPDAYEQRQCWEDFIRNDPRR